MVLLVVDTQKLITTPDLYNFNAFECAVKSLIAAARENNVEVIYVRHDDGAGAELTKEHRVLRYMKVLVHSRVRRFSIKR